MTMGVQSQGSNDAILVTVDSGARTSSTNDSLSKADFVLAAKPEQWQRFFDMDPKVPYEVGKPDKLIG
jgi:hypothetical protein